MMPRAPAALLVLSLLTAGCGSAASGPQGGGRAGADARSSSGPLEVGAAIRSGRAPAAVAVGAGSVWVANNTDGTVTRIDAAARRRVGRPVRVSPGPRALAFGAGAAWVATGSGFVERIPAGAGEPAVRARVADPAGVTVAGDSVWVSSRAENAVVRLDAASGRAIGAPIRVGRSPADVAATAGAVWVANTEDGSISPIDTRSGRAGRPVKLVDGQVLALAAGDGALWAAVSADPVARRVDVVRLDPETGGRDGDPVTVRGGLPVRLAVGQGHVWVTNAGLLEASGRQPGAALTRLDARDGGVVGRPVDVGKRPVALAVGEGATWVADQAADAVVAVRPG